MKLSEYIDELKKFFDEHGDMDTYYASDDEGNNYQRVCFAGSLFYRREGDRELCGEEDKDEESIPVCVIN